MPFSVVGRARGLMETWDSGYRVIVAGRGCNVPYSHPARRAPAPGILQPCSRAGNTPQLLKKVFDVGDRKMTEDISYSEDFVGRTRAQKITCPRCISDKIVKFGFRILRKGRIQRYKCTECGRTFCP